MLKNLPVLPRALPGLFLAILWAFLPAPEVSGLETAAGAAGTNEARTNEVRWYRSNSSGMPLEHIESRLVALRNEYSLSVQTINPSGVLMVIPPILLPYYDDSFTIELRILFERGRESRQQWIFRGENNIARLVSSGSAELFSDDSSEDGRSGFIEIRNSEGQKVRQIRFEDDLREWEFRFTYSNNILQSAETFLREAPRPDTSREEGGEEDYAAEGGQESRPEGGPSGRRELVLLTTDYFFYSRSGSIRAIDRFYHEEAETRLSRLPFPNIGGEMSPDIEGFSQSTVFTSAFLQNIYSAEGSVVSYTLDGRGRVLNEVWKDEEGGILGEFVNTWSTDRLLSVLWTTPDDELLVEYEYDDEGHRIMERNFRKGVLERSVSFREGREIEEVFMNGRIILRATWEDGIKISEERVFPSGESR